MRSEEYCLFSFSKTKIPTSRTLGCLNNFFVSYIISLLVLEEKENKVVSNLLNGLISKTFVLYA